MAFKLANRAYVLTATTGTGSISLGSVVAGYQSFSAAGITDGDTVRYTIEDGTNWEIGTGTLSNSVGTMSRSVIDSSGGGSALTLSGSAQVFLTSTSVDMQTGVNITGGSITGMSSPTANSDVTTKLYVDSIAAAGIAYHTPVRLCTTGALSAAYSNGTSGVGATLTNNSTQAALTIDGVLTQTNDRILVDQQSNSAHNGIYTVTTVGSGAANWVLTRATDADSYENTGSTGLGQGSAVFVSAGSANAGELHVCNVVGVITFGTTNITFVLVADNSFYTAGAGITLTGNQFSIDTATSNAITANTAKTGITSGQASAIIANTAKTGITSGQASAIIANTAKTGITSGQASAITANTAKVTNATHTGEVTGSGALTITDNVVDEANLKVSNSPTNGYFLSAQSGNTGGLTWAAAGAELYVANPQGSITAPTANGDNAVAIGNLSAADGNKSFAAINGRAAGTESTAIGWSRASGTGALALNVHETPYNDTYGASGDYSVSIGKSTKSSGDQSIALGYAANATAQDAMALGRDVIASATYSTAVGYDSEATASTSTSLGFNSKATNSGALALGNRSLASGVSSTAISITSTSTSYGANSDYGIAIGYLAKAGGGRSIVIGYQATANNFANATAIGYEAKVSALGNRGLSLGFRADVQNYGAVAISASKQGYGPIAAGEGSVAIGELVKSQQSGKYAFGVGTFSNAGEAQGGMFILRSDTTDATAEAMTTTNSTADATNQIVAATDTCITFHGTVVAMQNGAQAHAGWEIKGMLVNDGGTTTLALGNVSDMAATNASNWTVILSADNTNNALKVQVTGETGHNIRWVANVQTSEVTYA